MLPAAVAVSVVIVIALPVKLNVASAAFTNCPGPSRLPPSVTVPVLVNVALVSDWPMMIAPVLVELTTLFW